MPIVNDILAQAGLDNKEASVYTTLLNNGGLTVLEIANKSGQKRTNIYNILENLKDQNLVKEIKEETTTKYFPQSPSEIENLLERRDTMIRHARLNFEIILGELASQYNLISNKPIITYYEGISGIKKLYEDVLNTNKDILLIRSKYDSQNKKINDLVFKQLNDQAKRGINSKVINYIEKDQFEEAKELYTKYDPIRLVEERFVHEFKLDLPAQVLIYGNKISLATIKEDTVVTIIDNKDITQTFRIIFEFMWTSATEEHNKITKDWEVEKIS